MTGVGSANAGGVAWGRTSGGWALNLDGSSPRQFSLPRLEIEQSPGGWVCRCRLGDGTSRELLSHADSVAVAQRTAAELARGQVAGALDPVVDALIGA